MRDRVLVFPLYRASVGPGLLDGWGLSIKDCVEGVSQIFGFDVFGVTPVVVDSPFVLQHPFLIKNERVRCAYSPVSSRNLLGLVSQVWEVEVAFLCAFHHIRETVLWIARFIITVYRNQNYGFWKIVVLNSDHAILISLDVGAMVATEDYDYCLPVGDALKTV